MARGARDRVAVISQTGIDAAGLQERPGPGGSLALPARRMGPSANQSHARGQNGGERLQVIELVGTSTESWEKAAAAAITRASKSLRDLRVAEISELDIQLRDGKIEHYRAKVKVSFKYEGKE